MPEIDAAQIYIDQFYRRKTAHLVTMRWACTTGALQFKTGMDEKEIKTLGSAMFAAAFSLALAAIPGGFFISKTWKRLADARPVFADNIQYVVGVTIDASSKVGGALTDPRITGDTQQFSAALADNLKSIYSKINHGLSALEAERTKVERWVIRMDSDRIPGLLRNVKRALGPLPLILSGEQQDSFVNHFEYRLFHMHCKRNVTVVRNEITGRPASWELENTKVDYNVSGLNNGQLKYIYDRFGTTIGEKRIRELVGAAAKSFRNAKDYRDFRVRMSKNVKQFDGLYPILGPTDLAEHWDAKVAVKEIHYRHEPA